MSTRLVSLRRRAAETAVELDEARADAEMARVTAVFRDTKQQLKFAIMRSKKNCWQELIDSVDGDPFGKPYKMVMRKLRGAPATSTMEPQILRTVVDSLFPGNSRT